MSDTGEPHVMSHSPPLAAGSEDIARRLLEMVGQGIGWASMDGQVVYMNPALQRMLDLEPGEDVSRYNLRRFYLAEDQALIEQDMLPNTLEQGAWIGELPLLSAKGRILPTLHDVRLIRDDTGAPMAFACAITDLSLQKAQEQVLVESKAKYQALVDNIPQRVFFKDRQSRYLAVNHVYAGDLGIRPEEIVGRDDHAFHPKALAEKYRSDDARIMQSGQSEEFDEDYVVDGQDCTIHIVKTPVRDDLGRVIGVCGIFWDVSEHRRLAEKLEESEATLRAIYENIQEGILVASAETRRFVMANPAVCRMLGYSEAELREMTPEDLHAPEDLPRIRAHFRALEQGDFSPVNGIPFRCKDGRILRVNINARLVTIQGRPCFIGVLHDVTEALRSQEALQRSEETYARAEAIAHIGSWDWDITTGGLRWTDEIFRIFGLTPQSFGATYEAFLQALHPDDRQRVTEAVNASVADASAPYDLEHRVVRPSGEVRIVQERGQVYRDEAGKPVRMIGTVHDITEQKAAEAELARYREHLEELVRERSAELAEREAQLRRAQEIAHLGHWSVNLQTGEMYWSDEIFRIFGRDPATFTPSEERFYQVVHPEDRDAVRQAVAHAFARGEVFRADHRIVLPDGSIRWVHEEAVTETDAEGRPLRLEGTVHDITPRKAYEAALVQAKEAAEKANRAKSEFLSRMSHELRTPLNAILGFGQLLESDARHPLTGDQQENVAEILHGGRHLLELINEVLDLARIESGKLSVSLETLSIEPLLEECRALVGPMAEARGIHLHGMSSPVCRGVLADRTRLKQVLLNLLSNAVKYNREGGKVTLACDCRGGKVRLAVSDTGPGLSPEQLAKLFRPFERLGADRSVIEGTGIGLALSKRLAELMQGEMGVESTPGEGSTFWVELPGAEVSGTTGTCPPPQTAARGDTPDSAEPVGRRAVLYIEDNPANTRLMERILGKRKDLWLITADHPGLGLELAAAHRPHLILLDINLPDMDGYQVLTLLRARADTRHTPVIGISANAMAKDVERARAAGFIDYLTKPLDITHLIQTIDRALSAPPEKGKGVKT